MLHKLLAHPLTHAAVIAAVAAGVFACVFPQAVSSLNWVVNYAVQVMLLLLAGGVFFLFAKQPRLVFACFWGCLLLCLWLKFSIKNDRIERWREAVIQRRLPPEHPPAETDPKPPFTIAHVNVANAADLSATFAALRSLDAALLSFHEVTPDWDTWLNDSLASLYPYRHTMVDIGIFGMAVFSKFPLEQVDTFHFWETPSLRGCLSVNGDRLCFLSVHTQPALNESAQTHLRAHLASIAGEISRAGEQPTVVFGEFNAVAWSPEIQVFTDSTGLQESRTGFMPMSSGGTGSFFEVPLDHIFFSEELMCLGFQNLSGGGRGATRLGISGTYQFQQNTVHAQKSVQ